MIRRLMDFGPGRLRRLGLAALAAGSAVAWGGGALAQTSDGLKVSGSIRLRYEAVDGQVRPGAPASDGLINLRTILGAEYRQGMFRLGAEVRDSRAWGASRRTPVSSNEVDVLEPVQAYVGVSGRTDLLGPVAVQAGRFLLNLGSRRLMAADDYRNTTNSMTGVRLDLAPAGLQTTLVFVEPQVRLPEDIDAVLANRQHLDRESSDLEVWGGTVSKPKAFGGATLESTYLHLQETDSPERATRDRVLDTYGGRLYVDPAMSRWDYEVEGLVQTGRASRGRAPAEARLPVQAGFVHVSGGYTFAAAGAPRLSGVFDWATGDRGGDRYTRFDTLFGMQRFELGPAGLYSAMGRANLVSPGLRLDLAPRAPWDAFLVMRGVWLESPTDALATTGVRDPAGRSGSFGGVQLDSRLRYWLIRNRLQAEVDATWLSKGRFLLRAPNAPASGHDERYLSLNLSAMF